LIRVRFTGFIVVLLLAAVAQGACGRKPDGRASAAQTPGSAAALTGAAPEAPALPAQTGPPAVAVPAPCPPEMALIDGRFCIDRWEATTVNPDGSDHSPYKSIGPDRARAVSRAGVVPQAYVSGEEARLACQRSGKTLCTSQQWQDACMGVKRPHRVYPYGMRLVNGACNISRLHPTVRVFGEQRRDAISLADPRLNQLPDTVARTGAFERCVTPEGVYDLHGNLLEWTIGPDKDLLLGGHYVDAVKHGRGCEYVTAGHGDQYGDYTTGFRCCAPADKSALAAAAPLGEAGAPADELGAAPLGDAGARADEPAVAESVAAPDAGPGPAGSAPVVEPPAVPAATAAPALAGATRDPPGMRGFVDAMGKLPKLVPPAYDPPGSACPVDMVHIEGVRCSVPVQKCKRWLPRRSAGRKIACAEFEAPSICEGAKRKLDFCIDRLEFTPPGYTYPLTHVSWGEAQNLCREMDKRLCLETEWEFACEGPDALPFPYGYVRDPKRCNHDFPEEELVTAPDRWIDRRVAADALPGCKSPFGVLNMVGNVDEWTTREGREAPRRAILRGGWWLIGRNRCRAATDNHSELYAGVQTGFRCCKAARR
jgi:formylglycine-generating enzyme required for sulfatase activity